MSATSYQESDNSLGLAFRYGAFAMLMMAAASLVASWFVQEGVVRTALLAATGAMGSIGIGWLLAKALSDWRRMRRTTLLIDLVEGDPDYCFVTDGEGGLIGANKTARTRFSAQHGMPLAQVLRDVFASAEGILYRLQNRAESDGYAVEDITSHAEGFRVYTRILPGPIVFWRLEPDSAQASAARGDQAVLTLGRNGAVLYMNARAREIAGRRVKRVEEMIEDMPLRSGGVHKIVTADGPVPMLLHCAEIGAGRLELNLLSMPEKAQDEALDADLDGGFDNLPVPLVKVDPDGTILRANPEAQRMLSLDGASGGNLAEHMVGLGRALADWLQEASEGRGLHRSEFLRLTRDDKDIYVQVTLKQVTDHGKSCLVAVLNDATELKTLEMQFVQSQKMQAIGQLAGGVAHDFNNLLTAISGHCDLMLLRHDQGDPDYNDLVQINQNANRAASLVGQLLAFSRKQNLRREVLDLRDTLSDLTHLLNRLVGERVSLTLKHDPILPPVRGDKRQLEQVIVNLVVNARDAMPDGGEITVETERRVLREPLERDRAVVEPGVYVSVRIVDQGTGIPKDKLQKVFEPFFTTKRPGEGTGLGLSTVYGIVKQTGGFIFVDSVVGQGTCFTLLLPSFEPTEEEQVAKPEPEARKLPEKGSGVVLLVEDEAPVRAFAARALRLRGYTVIEAETAEEALSTLEDDELNVDIFVTDVVMPGMDGPSWVREARKARPDVRVVFVSGYAEDAFGEGRDEIPNSVFLPKPFSLTDLTETVHQQLN
ncbi:ATP-binding protein [Pacificoceanicola onchidii]|uniref:hybrid sensor histidine kinase/response regulator n=1 Tax=Pacificoceanicola onchidii TaxID=2562685 RepID=UPI001F0D0E75|nr:ATP-binding protein [Pacificoceanicola onchidii]